MINTIILNPKSHVHAIDLGYQTFTRCGKIISDYSKKEVINQRHPYTVNCEICIRHLTQKELEQIKSSGCAEINDDYM